VLLDRSIPPHRNFFDLALALGLYLFFIVRFFVFPPSLNPDQHKNSNVDLTPVRSSAGVAFLALAASSGTLVCCVLPTLMVALGAGVSLAGLVTAVPQLIWLSEHKGLVFSVAAFMLLFSGWIQLCASKMPCPADPVLGRACAHWRKIGKIIWISAVFFTALGAFFAFVLPHLIG
jgi:hypothetical protein